MKKIKVDLAIIIPTLNEELFIGKLLDSIAKQTVQPNEVVVVDAFSQDKTLEEIKKRLKKLPQLKYYQVPKYTISRQRNFGAKKTTATHLLFLDADMLLSSKDTLENYLHEVITKNPDIAAATNLPLSNNIKDKIFFNMMDAYFKTVKPIWPSANGQNMYITRNMFKKVGGFDEEIRIGEDHEMVQRVVKNKGKFIFLKNTKVHTSVRRLEKEGRTKFALKVTGSLIKVLTKGYRNNDTEYEFGDWEIKSSARHQ